MQVTSGRSEYLAPRGFVGAQDVERRPWSHQRHLDSHGPPTFLGIDRKLQHLLVLLFIIVIAPTCFRTLDEVTRGPLKQVLVPGKHLDELRAVCINCTIQCGEAFPVNDGGIRASIQKHRHNTGDRREEACGVFLVVLGLVASVPRLEWTLRRFSFRTHRILGEGSQPSLGLGLRVPDALLESGLRAGVEGRGTVAGRDMDVRTMPEEDRHGLRVSGRTGVMKRRPSADIALIHIYPSVRVNDLQENARFPRPGGEMQYVLGVVG